MNIIGITGPANSGKSTVARILVRNHNFVEVAFADSLKRALKEIFDFTDEQLWGPSEKRNKPDRRYPRTPAAEAFACETKFLSDEEWQTAATIKFGEAASSEYLTPRHAAQQLGTEFGRSCYPNTWVDKAMETARKLLDPKKRLGYYSTIGAFLPDDEDDLHAFSGVVISDCRFPNEDAAIHAAGGVLWSREGAETLTGDAGAHSSESYFSKLRVDKTIQRLEDVSYLPAAVDALLKGYPIFERPR